MPGTTVGTLDCTAATTSTHGQIIGRLRTLDCTVAAAVRMDQWVDCVLIVYLSTMIF